MELEVEDIVECPAPEFGEEAEYLALSPIVFMVARPNRSMEYVGRLSRVCRLFLSLGAGKI